MALVIGVTFNFTAPVTLLGKTETNDSCVPPTKPFALTTYGAVQLDNAVKEYAPLTSAVVD